MRAISNVVICLCLSTFQLKVIQEHKGHKSPGCLSVAVEVLPLKSFLYRIEVLDTSIAPDFRLWILVSFSSALFTYY